jgi:RNA polymerase sigma factor (sigma-70 family)
MVDLVKSSLSKPEGLVQPEEARARERFARTCDPIIRQRVGRVVRDQHDIDDLTQDVWVSVLGNLQGLEFDPARATFSSWFNSIAWKRAIPQGRRCKPPPERGLSDRDAECLVDPAPGPDTRVERKLDFELFAPLVNEFAATLTERDRRIIELHGLLGYSPPEIASVMHLPAVTIRSVVERVGLKLMCYLRRNASDPRTPPLAVYRTVRERLGIRWEP